MNRNGAPHDYQNIAVACQGGGSLGAYHVGSLQAMQEADYAPDAVAGISIGAFTAAIVAGNEPTDRIPKLKAFWDLISWPDIAPLTDPLGAIKKWHNLISSYQGFMFGQPGFFAPWFPPPFLQSSGTPAGTSFYDTSLLLRTLPEVVDFGRINRGKTHLILGATRVRDGSPRWFDSHREKIGPEHVMASGAMPPGFPGIRIDGELYWDGGCYSNTPLDGLYDVLRGKDTLCFVIDLFGPNGREPQNLADVMLTMKEIQFSNRISHDIERVRERHNYARQAKLERTTRAGRFDFVHILYQKPGSELSTCDCEFSRSSIQDRMLQGYCDMKKALAEREQLAEDQKKARELAPVGSIVNTFAKGTLVQTSFHPARVLAKVVSYGKRAGVSLGAAGRGKRGLGTGRPTRTGGITLPK